MAPQNNSLPQSGRQAPKSGYGFLESALYALREHGRELAKVLESYHEHGGRKGHPRQGMLCAYDLQFLLNVRHNNRFLITLNANPRLLAMCGLEQAPSEGAYCNFVGRLARHRDLLDPIFADITQDCAAEIERLGEVAAFDATDIEACASPDNEPCADLDASWGKRTAKSKSGKGNGKDKDKKDKMESFFGYKALAATDAYHGLPLYLKVCTARESEGPHLREDLKALLAQHPTLKLRCVLAYKAYHAGSNFERLAEPGITPVIAVPKPPKDQETGKRLYEGIYDEEGRPAGIGRQPMDYLGTDPEGHHYFRCPAQGCRLKDKTDWSRYCDTEYSEKPEGKLRRIMGALPRFTAEWKRLYRMRTGIERWFSTGKRSRLLNQHQHLDQERISVRAGMSMLAYQLTALAHLRAGDYAGMRQMHIKLPRPSLAAEPSGAQECADCCLCPQHGRLAA